MSLSNSVDIPTRRVEIDHESKMPSRYSETPGGTIFSTTPGGTRIIYERKFLLNLKQSPLARTPNSDLPVIPGVTLDDSGKLIQEDVGIYSIAEETPRIDQESPKQSPDDDQSMFNMDM